MLLNISSPGSPFIKLAKSSSEAVVGGMVTLTCTDSRGVPPPDFYWSKCESNLENSPCQALQHGDENLMIMRTMSNTSELRMNPVQIAHVGVYQCSASNVFGTDRQKITVQVACKWRV